MDKIRDLETLDQMERVLDGSPYLLDTSDVELLERFWELNKKRLRHKEEWDEVHDALEEIGGLTAVQNDERIPFIHQSNRLELEGPDSQAGTEAALGDSLDRDLESSDVVAGRMILEGLTGDERVTRSGDEAFRYAWQIAGESDLRITQSEIRSINQIIETGKQYKDRLQKPGAYRTRDAQIAYEGITDSDESSAKGRETAMPVLIEPQMSELVSWLNKNFSNVYEFGPMIACVAHAWLTDIHPFTDGNGRTARLLANIILAHGRWPPLVIKAEHRTRYLNALEESDAGGHIFPLYELFLEFLEQRMRIIQNQDEVAQSVYSFRHDQVRIDHYELWKWTSEEVISRLIQRVKSAPITGRVDDFPDFEDYCQCRIGMQIPRAWAFRLGIDRDDFLLGWHGHNTPVMKNALDERGAVLSPSLFFDLWQPSTGFRPWVSAGDADGSEWQLDEICVVVPEGKNVDLSDAQVLVRPTGQINVSEDDLIRHSKKTPERFWRGTDDDIYTYELDELVDILVSQVGSLKGFELK
jgi:Fic family protein